MTWRKIFSKMSFWQCVCFFFHYLMNPTHGKAYTHDGDILIKVDCPDCEKVFFLKRTIDDFRNLDKTFTPEKTVATFGKPDLETGSGLIIYIYALADGSKVQMGFPGNAPIQYAFHMQDDKTFKTLIWNFKENENVRSSE